MSKVVAKYFKEAEFQKCDPPCSLQDMNQGTMDKLDAAREGFGKPMILNCAGRTKAHELKQGRKGTSAHVYETEVEAIENGKAAEDRQKCHAVDIRCLSDSTRWELVEALKRAGFKRIGVAKTFVHADDSPRHTQNVMWTY